MRGQLFILLILILLPDINVLSSTGKEHKNVTLKIRVKEEDTHQITPVMVCITSLEDGLVRIPPSGQIVKSGSDLEVFFKGIEFMKDKNWTGPVRKMTRDGIPGFYSFAYKGLQALPYWSEPAMYQTSGDFSIELPAGKWRISMEHGNEYIPVNEEFIISGKEKELTKIFILKRWIDLPSMGWYSGDIHVHHPTNKPEFREFLLAYAKAEDVHMVNVLEMGDRTRRDFEQEGFGEKFRTMEGKFCLASGQEDPRSTYGHVIGLNISNFARDTSRYNYYDIIFKLLHQQPGALSGFAHYAWNGNGTPMGIPLYLNSRAIDFLELLQNSQINTSEYFDLLNLGLRITAAAGSDVPWSGTIGEVRTFVYSGKDFSADAWFKGMESGQTFVSNGPVILLEIDNKLPGSEITKSSGSEARLSLKALSNPGIGNIVRVAVYNNNGVFWETKNPDNLDSIAFNTSFIPANSQWVTAAVYCDNGAVALTTPVYIIVDGHPTWNAKTATPVICRNIASIKLMEDMELASYYMDQGIIKRLELAHQFFTDLMMKVNADK